MVFWESNSYLVSAPHELTFIEMSEYPSSTLLVVPANLFLNYPRKAHLILFQPPESYTENARFVFLHTLIG